MIRKLFWRAALLLILLAGIAGTIVIVEYRRFIATPLAIPADGYRLDVKSGSSLSRIAEQLRADGVIADPLLLRALGRVSGQAAQIKAGEYQLNPGATPPELLGKLVAGDVIQYSLTIVEGWTFKQLMEAVRSEQALKQTLAAADHNEIMARIGAPDLHPEGQFLPETYRFPRGMTDIAFLKRAFAHMQQRLAEEWEKREPNLPVKNPYEALILASIIERETGVAAERPQIAGVFVRRLQKRMRLQTDPTVIYGMGDGYQGDIRFRDLRQDTVYNTYTRAGLPPTPIAMPSAAAIHAALHPAPGDELYFVSRGDGSHHFSSTLSEHNAAVRRYQLRGARR